VAVTRYIALCLKQEYQGCSIPHELALSWLEGGVIDDRAAVDAIISVEMPREGTPGIEHVQDLHSWILQPRAPLYVLIDI
jgi:hypothetical protein